VVIDLIVDWLPLVWYSVVEQFVLEYNSAAAQVGVAEAGVGILAWVAVVFVSVAADSVLAVFVAASEDIAVAACTGGGVAVPVCVVADYAVAAFVAAAFAVAAAVAVFLT